jgi:glucokinase
VDNDATCATVAEWRTGAGAGTSDMLMVTFGTGIGGGIVMDGALRRGAHGYAGEIGHITVVESGERCACGRRGCWEAYASGSALARLGGVHDGAVVTEAASAGDPAAVAVVATYADWVAVGLAALVNVVDPEVIVLGGGVMTAHGTIIGAVREAFVSRIYGSDARALPRIETSVHGESAGAIGAGLMAGLG